LKKLHLLKKKYFSIPDNFKEYFPDITNVEDENSEEEETQKPVKKNKRKRATPKKDPGTFIPVTAQ